MSRFKGKICFRSRIHLAGMIFDLTHRIAHQSTHADTAFEEILSYIETPFEFDNVQELSDDYDEEPF